MASRRHARSRFRARSVAGTGRGRQIQSVDGGIQRVNVGWVCCGWHACSPAYGRRHGLGAVLAELNNGVGIAIWADTVESHCWSGMPIKFRVIG